jgi:RNA polymerase sigma-70 factor (sigma-E family)
MVRGQGINAEFSAYVAARGPALLRMAYLLTGNHADAEDLLQTALAKTYLAWGNILDKGALDGYVRRVLVNTRTSWWRRRRVDEFPTWELPDAPYADGSGEHALHDAVWSALARLPRRQRAMIVLRYYEDLTEPEIATIMEVSVGTVKSTVSRALDKLRADGVLRDSV